MNFDGLVFDAYGTLFDLTSLEDKCEETFPGNGAPISRLWRQKQLEYSWLRALMGRYVDFSVVTRDALRYTLNHLKLSHTEVTIDRLSTSYFTLNPFSDVADALRRMRKGSKLAVLSNGTKHMLKTALSNSKLTPLFAAIISADQASTYKPDRRVYALALTDLGISDKKRILLVSSNVFDIAGAKSFGFCTAWVNRNRDTSFDMPDLPPDIIVSNLSELAEHIA
ncbi:MAG TPA: haloacid dehalogenase type II [Candidatus Bathyarchaeia archaeon]|nr:haloacid dehalogenase type II [Candidatus Bathyarchaeia archaeon]